MSKQSYMALGFLLMLLGAFLVLTDATIMLYITLGVDTAPPVLVSSVPFDKSKGYVPQTFKTNKKVNAHVTDLFPDGKPASGVKTVQYTDEQHQYATPPTVSLSRISGTAADGVWEATVTQPYSSGVEYWFRFIVADAVGNGRTYEGTFIISYGNLQGRWLINGIEITEPTQTIWVKTATVTFRFEKTAGAPDAEITCTLSGEVTATLPKIGAGVWEIQRTLADGTYDITMKAEDTEGHTVIMNIYQLQTGEGGDGDGQASYQYLAGFVVIGLGLYCVAISRTKRGEA